MLKDASFRILNLNRKYKVLQETWVANVNNMTPAEKAVIKAFVEYVNEISRIVTKEEGTIERLL
jgi:hypothetical protein